MSSDGILSEVENKLQEVDINQTENTAAPAPANEEKPKKSKKKNKSKSLKNDENKAEEKVITEEPYDAKAAAAKLEAMKLAAAKKKEKKTAVAKVEANKVAAAKKKSTTKVKNWKNTDSGQFWWHDQ